jgi:transposase
VEELERAYRNEEDPDVKERMLLVLRVKGDGAKPSKASTELHRTKPWASKWLKRFQNEGIDGLRTMPRSGRPSRLSAEVVQSIRREISQNRQGWKTRQVYDLIVKRSGVRYHYTRVYQLLHDWGFSLKVPRKRHINTASKEEKEDFKKGQRDF